MYEELVKAIRETRERVRQYPEVAMSVLPYQLSAAADAIEELNRENESLANSVNEASEILRKRWIPVTERLPEKSGDYLVFDDCGNLYVNEWHCPLRMWQYDDSRITHWMPLPEPPTANKEET